MSVNVFEYIGASPVSRSQVKYLVELIGNTGEVTIDFDKVEWVSPSFMHQLFVVYPNNNPSVKLISENMNDAVRRMYRHVKPDK